MVGAQDPHPLLQEDPAVVVCNPHPLQYGGLREITPEIMMNLKIDSDSTMGMSYLLLNHLQALTKITPAKIPDIKQAINELHLRHPPNRAAVGSTTFIYIK